MSRRKQAKPRALKRSDWEETSPESEMGIPEVSESTSGLDIKDTAKSTGDGMGCILTANGDVGDGERGSAADSPVHNQQQIYRCASCGLSLTSLKTFMDHRNFDCIAGVDDTLIVGGSTTQGEAEERPVAMETENSLESDATMSGRATSWLGDNDVDNPSTTRSPSTCSLTPTETDQNEAIVGGSGGAGGSGVIEATPYACQFCDKAFPRLSYLKRHEQGHGDLMPFKCDFCHRLFKHKRSRDRHVKLHTGDKKYRCSHCDSAFSRSDHLKIHMKTHDTAKPFQCTVCNRGYNTAAALTSHMQNHKKANTIAKRSFRCLQCTASFLTSVQLKDHLMTHSSGSSSPTTTATAGTVDRPVVVQQCPICVKDFTSLDTLYQHMKTHTDVAVVVGGGDVDQSSSACSQDASAVTSVSTLNCVYCTKDCFQTLELLQLHVQTMHGSSMLTNGDRSPPNPHSKAVGRSVRHRRSTPSPAPQPPPQSSLPVPANASKSHHQQQLSCEYCTMRFNSIQALQKHTLSVHSFNDLMSPSGSAGGGGGGGHRSSRHTGSPGDDTVCQHCTMGFKSDAALTEHVKLVHGGDFGAAAATTSLNCDLQSENVKCAVDPASPRTESSSSPNNGGAKVSTDQDFAHPGTLLCNQCNAAFPDFEAFRTHLKTHLDEVVQKHVCGECAGEFGSAEELECHAAGHFLATTTEYGCQSCLKLFSKPDELQKHLMDIHAHHLYRCSLCHKVFDSKVSVQVHFAVKHSNECKLYKCTGCSSVFRSELEFNVHVKVSHVRRAQPFRCLFCQFSYDSELELQCHLTTHKKQFKCRLCDDAFHVEFLLDRHVQNKHSSSVSNSSVNCSVTAASSDVTVTVASTAASAAKNKGRLTPTGGEATTTTSTSPKKSKDSCRVRAPCDGCDAEFASEISLNAHRRQTHHRTTAATAAAAAACSSSSGASSIGKQSSSTSAPTTTATTTTTTSNNNGNGSSGTTVGHHQHHQHHGGHHHHHVLSLHCAYCNESCKSRTELEQHVTRSHRNANCSGKHKCNICDELCPTATLLAEHKLTTHCKVTVGSMCVLCKANLKTEEQFYSHLQQHGGGGGAAGGGVDGSSPTSTNADAKNNNSGSGMLPVPCVVCRQTLMTEIDVQMHGKFHLRNVAEPLHPCCLCLKLYEPINLIENSIGAGQSFICKECFHRGTGSSSSAQSPSLISSAAAAAGNDRLRCPECRVKFETSAELESHLRTASCCSMIIGGGAGAASIRKTYQCIKCQASFDSESEIQVHVATHVLHEGTCHECRLCARTFDSPAKLQCHLVEHTFEGARGGGYACYMCSAVFTTAALLQAHMLEHGLDSRPYDCSLCHQRFFFRAELENHAFSHGMADDGGDGASALINGTSKCPQCPELDFVTSTDMQRHFFDVHGVTASTSCRMSALLASDQSTDFRLRQRSKSGSCYECPSSGVGDHHLHVHHQAVGKRLQLHGTVSSESIAPTPTSAAVIKPYECPGCRRRFARNDNLRAHVQKSRCGGGLLNQRGTRTSSTSSSSSSAGGRQTRSGVGMNSKAAAAAAASRRICGVCSVATVSTRALRRHMRDTHGRKYEFSCPLCADPFSATDSLERHLKRSHGVNGVNEKKLCFENSANAVGVANYGRCPSASDMSVNDDDDDDHHHHHHHHHHRPPVVDTAGPMEQDQECGSTAVEDPKAADSAVLVKSEIVTSG